VAVAAGDHHTLVLVSGSQPSMRLLWPGWVGNNFSVAIQTLNRQRVALEFKTSIEESNWTAWPYILGNGALQLLEDPAAFGAQRIYRARWLP
jgi:hypothetical protein